MRHILLSLSILCAELSAALTPRPPPSKTFQVNEAIAYLKTFRPETDPQLNWGDTYAPYSLMLLELYAEMPRFGRVRRSRPQKQNQRPGENNHVRDFAVKKRVLRETSEMPIELRENE